MKHDQSLYTTQNRFLAKAIAFCGIPFSVYREYDQKYLESHGCRNVKDAERRRLPGREMWAFENSEKIKKIEAAFDAENDAIDELIKTGADLPFCEDAKIDTKCREFVRAMRGSKLVDETLFKTKPYFRVSEEGDPVIEQGENGPTVRVPGFKAFPINASSEIRKHLKV